MEIADRHIITHTAHYTHTHTHSLHYTSAVCYIWHTHRLAPHTLTGMGGVVSSWFVYRSLIM